jgi:hypothetical protein
LEAGKAASAPAPNGAAAAAPQEAASDATAARSSGVAFEGANSEASLPVFERLNALFPAQLELKAAAR